MCDELDTKSLDAIRKSVYEDANLYFRAYYAKGNLNLESQPRQKPIHAC
jgi:hypothetical protein